MVCYRVFGLLTITLCIVASLCAGATGSVDSAKKDIEDVLQYTMRLMEKARGRLDDANYTLRSVEYYKEIATRVASQAEEAAKGNKEAEAIAEKVKSASDKVLHEYPAALEAANKDVDRAKQFFLEAQQLDEEAGKLHTDTSENKVSTLTNTNVTSLKAKVQKLNATLDGLSLPESLRSALGNMHKHLQEANLGKYHIYAFLTVAKLGTLLNSTETYINLTEQKGDELNATIKEIKELYEKNKVDLTKDILSLQSSGNAEFRSALRALEEAKITKNNILELKKQADDALSKLNSITTTYYANNALRAANLRATTILSSVEKIKQTLSPVEISATNATDRMKAALKIIVEIKSKLGDAQGKYKAKQSATAKSHSPVQEKAETYLKSATTQSEKANPDQPTMGSLEKRIYEASSNEKLQQVTKDKSNIPVIGGKDSTWGTGIDSAMTVSVPLLLALIACAALH